MPGGGDRVKGWMCIKCMCTCKICKERKQNWRNGNETHFLRKHGPGDVCLFRAVESGRWESHPPTIMLCDCLDACCCQNQVFTGAHCFLSLSFYETFYESPVHGQVFFPWLLLAEPSKAKQDDSTAAPRHVPINHHCTSHYKTQAIAP